MRFCNQYTLRFDIGASPPSPRRLDRLCVQMQQVETLCVSKKWAAQTCLKNMRLAINTAVRPCALKLVQVPPSRVALIACACRFSRSKHYVCQKKCAAKRVLKHAPCNQYSRPTM